MKYFFINNTKINFISTNRSIIEYCDNLGIVIPHYCYHPKLSISGNCRMCLVEVKNSPKPVVSCAMTLLNKMEIFTDSPLVKKSRESVLEFLLLNHPLDCPVCDQGGECDLQDQSFVFGINKKRFYNFKRIVTDKNLGPVVKTVMTRCIHCTRCVRFSKEIAGVESLGIFGRGVNSEIGTYVNKLFNSELSGNIIDICPVGALTSKHYPFVNRVWELNVFKSIDYFDSMSSNIQVYTKSNSILKIVSDFDYCLNSNNWISDKTRLSFDGMFSPNRLSSVYISIEKDTRMETNWSNIFKNIELLMYFQDHLCRHKLLNLNLHIIFNNSISTESLCLLILLNKKYNFLKLRKVESCLLNVNNETFFLSNDFIRDKFINNCELCVIINSNPRYENPSVNIRLRKNYLKGNLKFLILGSLIDLTYPLKFLGSTTQTIKNLLEGFTPSCQDFIHSNHPILILSSNFLKRKDSNNIVISLKNILNNMKLFNKSLKGYNLLNSEINESGVRFLNKFKNFNLIDLSSTSGLILIDFNFNSIELKKLINLKLINLFQIHNKNKLSIELQNNVTYDSIEGKKKDLNLASFFSLPNKIFFEDSNIFYNNLGSYKKTVKIIPSINKSKENWLLIRKLLSSIGNLSISSPNLVKKTIIYESDSFLSFIKYITFQFFPGSSLENTTFFYTESKKCRVIDTIFTNQLKKKHYTNKFFFWLEDFYIGGKDNYSKFSSVMIRCSKSFRDVYINFNYIL